jgi:benzylsuccinate CoA-transferase BbsE subunit
VRGQYSTNSLLSPYRILDLTDEKGFLCGKILGDLGADVIKVERPGGDASRDIGPFYHDVRDPEKSLYWFAYNTSKRGITLNVETKKGIDIFKMLVRTADCVIESFPVGYTERVGLDFQSINNLNPRTVVTSISPFGQSGPYKQYKICDIVAQAMSGMMQCCGEPNESGQQFAGAESRQAYLQAGAQAAVGTMITLWWRDMTGEGQHVDVSIVECMTVSGYGHLLALYWEFEKKLFVRRGAKTTRGPVASRIMFPCKDGYVATEVMVGTRGNITSRLVKWMDSEGGAEDLKDVEWSKVDMAKVTQSEMDHWNDVVCRFLLKYTQTELEEQAIKWGFMVFPVKEPKDLLDNPQLKFRKFFANITHPELKDTLTYCGAPYRSTLCTPEIKRRAPLIGEHNEEIYGELGINKEEQLALKEVGVI